MAAKALLMRHRPGAAGADDLTGVRSLLVTEERDWNA
jgi:hypothetical protein